MITVQGNQLYPDFAHCEAAYLLPTSIAMSDETYTYFHSLYRRLLSDYLEGNNPEVTPRQLELIGNLGRTVGAYLEGGASASQRDAPMQTMPVMEEAAA